MYAGTEIGVYGFHEKPWCRPGQRMAAFLAEIERRSRARAPGAGGVDSGGADGGVSATVTDPMLERIAALLDRGLVYEHFEHHVAAYEGTRLRIRREADAFVVEHEVFPTGGSGAVSKDELRFDDVEFGAWVAALPDWERERFERWAAQAKGDRSNDHEP